MNTAYLLTGGNVGNRQQNLANAARLIEEKCGKMLRRSAIYETAAWGKTDQPAFFNQTLELSTPLTVDKLMHALLEIEQILGRERTEKYGPRTIDIDILLFNHDVIQTPLVTVPHLHMTGRRFVLEPLNELIPDYMHPVLKQTIHHLLQICPDTLPVKKFSGK